MKSLKNSKISYSLKSNLYDILIIGGGLSGLTLISILGMIKDEIKKKLINLRV